MTSLVANNKNPFLKDYQSTFLLKKNYQLIKTNHQLKQNQNPYHQLQYHQSTQKKYLPSPVSNPFQKKTPNLTQLIHEKRNNNNLQLPQARSLSHSRNLVGSLQKNTFYRGLEDIGTKQLWKTQLERQVRNKLKQYGPQTLRYQYHPTQKFTTKVQQQKPVSKSSSLHSNQPSKFKSYNINENLVSKKSDELKKTPSFNNNVVTSEYYGYDDFKQVGQDSFHLQKSTKKSHQKRPSTFLNDRQSKHKKHERHSFYDQIIPQDRNQDIQTLHNLNKLQVPHIKQSRKSNTSYVDDPKRTSIQYGNSSHHHDISVSSAFGAPSQMYESGANFHTRFGHQKNGPLCMKMAFDDHEHDNRSEQWENDQSISGSHDRIYPQTLEYNNKIYKMIPL